ncbi:MAG: glutathione S-transferase N-terminal domain-containing protein [Bacteriovoracaceae bacterium]
MKKLELYYFPECPYCQIVLETIEETNLKDKISYYNTNKDPARREKLIKDTGRATVPCLYIDDKPMHESRDISNWLQQYAKEV